MVDSRHPTSDEVEELLRNAQLRDELEPFYDESISRVNVRHLSLSVETSFLPRCWRGTCAVLPIYAGSIQAASAETLGLGPDDLHKILWDVIRRLYEKQSYWTYGPLSTNSTAYLSRHPAGRRRRSSFQATTSTGTAPTPAATGSGSATTRRTRARQWAETYRQPLPQSYRPDTSDLPAIRSKPIAQRPPPVGPASAFPELAAVPCPRQNVESLPATRGDSLPPLR